MGDWAERQRVWEESGGLQSERGDLPEEQGPNRRQDRWQQDAGWQRDDWRRQRDDWHNQPDSWRRQPDSWRNQRGNWEDRQGSEWRERQGPNRRQDAGWQGNRAGGQGEEGSRVGWERQQDNWRGQDDWRRQDDRRRQQEDNRRRQREDEWQYRQRGPGEAWNEHRAIRGEREEWQDRQRGGPGGNWQERARREGWFARDGRESQDRRPEDSFGDENFYANRGWARPSSPERDRDWGYYRGRQVAGDRYQNDQHGLPIDYLGSGEDLRSWRNEREYGRGAEAEHELSRQRGQNWDAQHNRPWDESQELNRERGFERGDQRQRGENWDQSGPFRGVGPQGYQRADERIKEEVCERLTWHGQIDASQIEVDVKEGEVTLRGQVEHKHTKRLAEDVVEKINGVKDVQNQLRVTK
jgi:hypothetical protein